MADNGGSNIVAIFAIIVIVLIAAALVYFLMLKGNLDTTSTSGTTVITQPTKVIEKSTSK